MLMFLLFCTVIGGLVAREANIDINRIRLLPKEASNPSFSHGRRSVSVLSKLRNNDYDDYSGGYFGQSPPIRLPVPMPAVSSTQTPLQVHQPREDPRLFYQSDSYIKEVNRKSLNHEVSFIYPGRQMLRANEDGGDLQLRSSDRELNMINVGRSLCIKCPHDRTLVAKTGSDRIFLQAPRLFSCSGRKAPRNVHFVHMYGPKFGSLIERGTHLVIGRVMIKDKSAQLCKMQIHVVTQGCPIPNYLVSQCSGENCTLACQDPTMDLHGQSSLTCGSNMEWTGKLPICSVRAWCEPPPPPEHGGRVSCRGITSVRSPSGLVEGSKCRVHCPRNWRPHPRTVAICRKGQWTNSLKCQKIDKPRKS